MIAWFFIGFLVALFAIWDLFYREGSKEGITNGELISSSILLTVFGPISILWAVMYEPDRQGIVLKFKSWWNRGVK